MDISEEKTKELREAIADVIYSDTMLSWMSIIPRRWLVNKIMDVLRSRGLVFKVEGSDWNIMTAFQMGYDPKKISASERLSLINAALCQHNADIKAGYSLTVPIKEGE